MPLSASLRLRGNDQVLFHTEEEFRVFASISLSFFSVFLRVPPCSSVFLRVPPCSSVFLRVPPCSSVFLRVSPCETFWTPSILSEKSPRHQALLKKSFPHTERRGGSRRGKKSENLFLSCLLFSVFLPVSPCETCPLGLLAAPICASSCFGLVQTMCGC
jgi:hypothetical protein